MIATGLAYFQARDLLITEIQDTLQTEAITVMGQIEATLFERVQNLITWSNQDLMQEIRIDDVDKRLSEYFLELRRGYDDFYEQLYAVSNESVIIAASPKSLIGKKQVITQKWFRLYSAGKPVFLEHQDLLQSTSQLMLRTRLDDKYSDTPLGHLYAAFNWDIVSRLLDPKVEKTKTDSPSMVAFLVNSKGKVIARSNTADKMGLIQQSIPSQWLEIAESNGVMLSQIDSFNDSDVIVGYARSEKYHGLSNLGWTTFIIQSRKAALKPVSKLWITSFFILAVVIFLAALASLIISNKISRPITLLTNVTREYMHTGKFSMPPIIDSYQEVSELSRTFDELIDNLETSRTELINITKLAVIGEMAATLAHDVRTPLGILRSAAQMIQREKSLSVEGLEMTEIIVDETHRLNSLVKNLLDCASPKTPLFEQYDVHEILSHCVLLLGTHAKNKGVRMEQQLSAHTSIIRCDKDQLIQVFLNLILNAIQNIEQGCCVQIITGDRQDNVIVEINDDGPGIDKQDREKIFEPFFTRRSDGTGLGLTVVQQIVTAHHSTITAHSSQQGGASFHLVFPLCQQY
jgi:signal transduction histidine kinase